MPLFQFLDYHTPSWRAQGNATHRQSLFRETEQATVSFTVLPRWSLSSEEPLLWPPSLLLIKRENSKEDLSSLNISPTLTPNCLFNLLYLYGLSNFSIQVMFTIIFVFPPSSSPFLSPSSFLSPLFLFKFQLVNPSAKRVGR